MQQTPTRNFILENLAWFALSLALALVVWIIAVTQSDPIDQRLFTTIPVQIVPDEGLLITSNIARTATVTVRAPGTVLNSLAVGGGDSDIVVRADLSGLEAGTHIVELRPEIAARQGRAVAVDTRPRQITVVLENLAQRQIPLNAVVTAPPPTGYRYNPPTFDVDLNQVLVTGPESKVAQVVTANIALDLSAERNPLELLAAPVPVDAEGNPVSDVTIEPRDVTVNVDIQQRGDVRQVRVTPNILVETLPEGYVLNSISYEPQTVTVSGSPERLETISGTFFTAPITLTGRTEAFEVSVPIQLPQNDLVILGGQNITVSVGISALTGSTQFDEVPITILGLDEGLNANLAPEAVTVLITGPQRSLENLDEDAIQVTVDLNGLEVGNYQLTPTVTLSSGEIPEASISVLPAEVDVQIVDERSASPP
jgi:YbbR domain-containing protein